MTWRRGNTTRRRCTVTFASLAVGAVAAAAASVLAGCGGADDSTVDVLAASSFTDVAVELEALLEDELDVDVRFSFGSSGSFLEQIDQGAPASVVITADSATMERIEAAGLVTAGVPVASNELVIVTSDTDAGRNVESLADLAAGPIVVVCASSAPCGAATEQLLAATGVDVDPSSREPNVRATLTKVLLGEADAAIVYRTDAVANPGLRTVEIGADNVRVVAHAAIVLDGDGERTRGADVVEVLTDRRAASLFADAGFATP